MTRKLNARRGASIVMALLIFLLCALAGVSAFIMAASNEGRYAHSSDQEYYSVSSAALLLVDMLDDLTYTSPVSTLVYERVWTFQGPPPATGTPAEGSGHTTKDGYTLTIANGGTMAHASTLRGSLKIGELIQTHCDELIPYMVIPDEWYAAAQATEDTSESAPQRPENKPAPVSYDFTVDVPNDDRYGTVHGRLLMDENFDLTLIFYEGESAAASEYSITVYWVAERKVDVTTEKPEYEYAEATGLQYTEGHLRQTSELQVTVSWKKKNVTISRGEAQGNVKA